VVISGIIYNLTAMPDGLFNKLILAFGGQPMVILGSTTLFQPILIISEIWKEAGWGTIIYLAAITRISVDLYEAARIDGASRFQQTIHITLSGIRDIVVVMLIMRIGNILNVGFEQVLVLQNEMVMTVGDTLDTYVWRVGLQNSRFSYAAAAGLFKAVTATVMIFAADRASKSVGEAGLL
jgi:putative aldouronate transport system permease protein